MLPGPTELALILVIVLILFGAGKLPQVFGALGEGLKNFKDAQDGTLPDLTSKPPPSSPDRIPSHGPVSDVAAAEEVKVERGEDTA